MTTDKPTLGEVLAELLGTLVLIALGDGVVAMVVLFEEPGKYPPHGGYTNITLGWGLAVLMGLAVSGRVSGGHLNPAITLALAAFRDFPWRKVPAYMGAQLAGAFAGAALVYVNYLPAFQEFDPDMTNPRSVAVFATAPRFPDAWAHGLLDQVVGTALLVLLVLAIVEPRNPFTAPALQPLLIALVVVAIGISWGGMHGYAINPARDLGPRLFARAAGFQHTGFADYTFLVPIAGPLLGGLLGALIYDCLVRPHVPAQAPPVDRA